MADSANREPIWARGDSDSMERARALIEVTCLGRGWDTKLNLRQHNFALVGFHNL